MWNLHQNTPFLGRGFSPLWAACLTLFWAPCSSLFWAPCGSIFFLLDLNLDHEICVSLSLLFAIIPGAILGLFFRDKHILRLILELFFHDKHLLDSQANPSLLMDVCHRGAIIFFLWYYICGRRGKKSRWMHENEGNTSFTWTISVEYLKILCLLLLYGIWMHYFPAKLIRP